MPTTLGNGSVIFGDNTFLTSANGKTFTAFTATGTYTVPTGVTSVRIYAFGGGGNGGGGIINTTTYGSGGGGGGCAYGDLTVTPGGTISVTIDASKNVVVSVSGTNHFYANCGVSSTNGAFGGNGGTAAISGSVTNGGAYAGGQGGNATSGSNRYAAGGGGAGSPLGIGGKGYYDNLASGIPAGGGGVQFDPATPTSIFDCAGGAGSAGGLGPSHGGSSALNATSRNCSRSVFNRYTDPLLQYCNGNPTNARFHNNNNNTELNSAWVAPSGPGCGGSASVNYSTTGTQLDAVGGAGGDFGGGGPSISQSGTSSAGEGGFGGGGGGAYNIGTGTTQGGKGGYGGGGGGAVRSTTAGTGGTGGPAIVLIYD